MRGCCPPRPRLGPGRYSSPEQEMLRGTIPSTLRNWRVNHTDLQLGVK